MGLLDELDDLQFLASRISHDASSPSPVKLFLSKRFSRVRSATTSFRADASRRRSLTSSGVAARAVSPASRFLLRESPSTSGNRGSGPPHGGRAPRCFPRRAGPPPR